MPAADVYLGPGEHRSRAFVMPATGGVMPIVYADAPEPDPVDVELAAALTRYLNTTSCPLYLRSAATPWLQARA